MPELNRYFNERKAQPFVLLGIDAEEKGDRVDAFLDELKVDFPAGVDEGLIRKKYGVESFPTTVVIGVDGKVQLYETGALANADVAFDNLLRQNQKLLQAGQTISPETYRLAAQNQLNLPLRQPEPNPEPKGRMPTGRTRKEDCCKYDVSLWLRRYGSGLFLQHIEKDKESTPVGGL